MRDTGKLSPYNAKGQRQAISLSAVVIGYVGDYFMALHCWKDYRDWIEEMGKKGTEEWLATFDNNKTCMAKPGHDGQHEWTEDSIISISFI